MMTFRRLLLVALSTLLLASTALAGTSPEGVAFLAKKEAEDGVVKLTSGLM